MERSQKVYFRPTTPQQRKRMMHVYQDTGSVTQACQAAKVSRGTFYRWYPRFQEQGEAGLEHSLSRAPHRPRRVKEELAQRALQIKQTHPGWGARSVAHLICQEHGYRRVISHRGVEKVWQRESTPALPAEGQPSPATREPPQRVGRADSPDKTVHLDLCFLPWQKLPESPPPPAAQASSGEALPPPLSSVPSYPGGVFQRTELSYDQQMLLYAQGRQERQEAPKPHPAVSLEEAALRQHLAELRLQQEEVRQQGRQARQARQEQEQIWRLQRQQRQEALQERRKLSRQQKKRLKRLHQQQAQQWKAQKGERQQALQRQKQEQAHRKARRQEFKKQEAELQGQLAPLLTCLVAVLVVVDNCTRRCLGLPLFLEGRHVQADAIVEALQGLLPAALHYLLTDNGSQFTAEVFQRLPLERGFLHVRISPRRPRTNGIAERFVRTLKERLGDFSWSSPEELQEILASILLAYNARPHQGKGLDGLSPNELDRRLREGKAKAEQKCAA